MLNIKNNRFYYILLSSLIILSDQFTKHIIDINHASFINNDLLFFSIDYVKNYGAAFNILNGSRIFLSTISTIITLFLIYFILLSLLICFIDQLTKNIINLNHNSLINKNFIIFSIDYVKNYGAAFNILNGSRVFLSTISLSLIHI